MMEKLAGYTGKVGFFRPVISSADQQDPLIQLITERYKLELPYEETYGCTIDAARELVEADRSDELLKRILAKYRLLQAKCDWVLCAGTDYHDGHSAMEFDFNCEVATMQVPDFLEYVEEGSLIITPADRADIIMACFASHPSTAYPKISGLLLTGKQKPAPQLVDLLSGLGEPPFAVLSVETDTFTTALNADRIRAELTADDEQKIAAALGIVEAHVDLQQLEQLLEARPGTRMTPLMFEYDLLQRAKAQQQHIVLPEGNEERILRAAEILALRGVAQLTLLGRVDEIQQKIHSLGLQLDDVNLVDPQQSELRDQYAESYYQLRKHKNISCEMKSGPTIRKILRSSTLLCWDTMRWSRATNMMYSCTMENGVQECVM